MGSAAAEGRCGLQLFRCDPYPPLAQSISPRRVVPRHPPLRIAEGREFDSAARRDRAEEVFIRTEMHMELYTPSEIIS